MIGGNVEILPPFRPAYSSENDNGELQWLMRNHVKRNYV